MFNSVTKEELQRKLVTHGDYPANNPEFLDGPLQVVNNSSYKAPTIKNLLSQSFAISGEINVD